MSSVMAITSKASGAGSARISRDAGMNRRGGGEMAGIPDTIKGCFGLWDQNKPECSNCDFKTMCMKNSCGCGQDGQ